MKEILDLGGRVALVTGAGQGVGRQIALHLAAHNAGGIAVNDFVLERAQNVVDEIRADGGQAIAVQADVTDLVSVKRMVERTEAELGAVGVLVNNAGNYGASTSKEQARPFWETGPEVWKSIIGVNFDGVLNTAAAIVPSMIHRQAPGRIITIISDAARWGDAGLEIYSGAKAGAAGFSRACARTLGRHQITVNCVSIAATSTPFMEARLKADPDALKRMLERYVIRRPGQPDDVANMVLFLASDASSWITGQVYPVNGGFTFAL